MSHKRNISSYIDEARTQTGNTASMKMSPVVFFLSAFAAAFILLLAVQPIFMGIFNKSNTGTSASAFGFACSKDLGSGMDKQRPWSQSFKDYPLADKRGRTLTLQEAFSAGTGVVNYSGEGKGNFWTSEKATPKGNNYKKYAAQYSDKLEAERTLGGCLGGTLMGSIANLGLTTADLISGIAQFFATKAFDTELVCANPSKPNGSCFNLGKVIGGTGSSTGGIIGALTSSVYTPLLIIAVAASAAWVIYIGLVKRQFREALFGAIWIILSVIFGLVFLLNPALLSKAPMALSNAVSTCVIGAFNGNNCMSKGSTGSGVDVNVNSSKNICRSSVSGANVSQKMMLTTNSITCSIWKAFVLEPYAQMSFGMSFEDLDSKNGAIKSSVEAAGLKGQDFCVDLYSSKSLNQMKNGTLTLQKGHSVCNVLVYQMYLQVYATSNGDKLVPASRIDDRWYKVVAVAASNDSLWSNWSGGVGSGFNQIMLALLSIIISALGSFIIIVTSAFALVYYVSAILLMAFAPVFFLMGIHPGRGKKIMFGWVEKVVSNLLKYFVSAVFLVVTLVIYGAILSSATNMGLILLFVIIITMALFMYRQELINMLGRANMGGEQLSGALATSLGGMAKGAGNKVKGVAKLGSSTAVYAAGGAAGAFLASGGVGGFERMSNAGSGAKDAMKRHISRQGGFVGNVARQYERSSVDNQQDLRRKTQDAHKSFLNHEDDAVKSQEALVQAEKDTASVRKAAEKDKLNLENMEERMGEFQSAENDTLDDMRTNAKIDNQAEINRLDQEIDDIAADESLTASEKNTMVAEREDKIAKLKSEQKITIDFVNYQNALNGLQNARMEYNHAKATGDSAGMKHWETEIERNIADRDRLHDVLGSENVSRLSRDYSDALQDNLNKRGIQGFSNEDIRDYAELRLDVHTAGERIASAEFAESAVQARRDADILQARQSEMKYDIYNETVQNLKPGDSLQVKDLEKMNARIEQELIDHKLTDEDIAGVRSKADELSDQASEYESPLLSQTDGRINKFGSAQVNYSDDTLSFNAASFTTDTNGNTEDNRNTEEPSDNDVPFDPEYDSTYRGGPGDKERFSNIPSDNDVPFDPEYDNVKPDRNNAYSQPTNPGVYSPIITEEEIEEAREEAYDNAYEEYLRKGEYDRKQENPNWEDDHSFELSNNTKKHEENASRLAAFERLETESNSVLKELNLNHYNDQALVDDFKEKGPRELLTKIQSRQEELDERAYYINSTNIESNDEYEYYEKQYEENAYEDEDIDAFIKRCAEAEAQQHYEDTEEVVKRANDYISSLNSNEDLIGDFDGSADGLRSRIYSIVSEQDQITFERGQIGRSAEESEAFEEAKRYARQYAEDKADQVEAEKRAEQERANAERKATADKAQQEAEMKRADEQAKADPNRSFDPRDLGNNPDPDPQPVPSSNGPKPSGGSGGVAAMNEAQPEPNNSAQSNPGNKDGGIPRKRPVNPANGQGNAPAPQETPKDENRPKSPTTKIAPPPYAPDVPMPTPEAPNNSDEYVFDDSDAPPAEYEVLPKDSKTDRKEHINNAQREQPVREQRQQPTREKRNVERKVNKQSQPSNASSMFENLTASDEKLAEEYYKQQQELLEEDLNDDPMPKTHDSGRGKRSSAREQERQQNVREQAIKGMKEGLDKSREIRESRNSLPTSRRRGRGLPTSSPTSGNDENN